MGNHFGSSDSEVLAGIGDGEASRRFTLGPKGVNIVHLQTLASYCARTISLQGQIVTVLRKSLCSNKLVEIAGGQGVRLTDIPPDAMRVLDSPKSLIISPGKPAGVKSAENMKETELYLFGAVGLLGIGLGIYLFRANNSTATVSTASAA